MAIEVIKNDLFKHRRDSEGKKLDKRKRYYTKLNNGREISRYEYRGIQEIFLKTKKEYEKQKEKYEELKKDYERLKEKYDDIEEVFYYHAKDKEKPEICKNPEYKHGLCIGSVGLAMSYKNDKLCEFINTLSSEDDQLSDTKDCKKIEEEYLKNAMKNHASYNEIKEGKYKHEGYEGFFLKFIPRSQLFGPFLKKTIKEIHEDFKNRATDSVSRLGFAIFIFSEGSTVGHVVYLVKYDNSIAFFEPGSGVIKAEISNANTKEAIDSLINSVDYKEKFSKVLKVKDDTKYDYYIHEY